jgi:hypothetical protein
MRNSICFLVICLIALGINSCSSKKGIDKAVSSVKINPADSGYYQFTVVDLTNLDGCRFMLKDSEGKEFLPINLSPENQVVDKEIWIKYSLKKGIPTTCMRGTVIEVTDYFE